MWSVRTSHKFSSFKKQLGRVVQAGILEEGFLWVHKWVTKLPDVGTTVCAASGVPASRLTGTPEETRNTVSLRIFFLPNFMLLAVKSQQKFSFWIKLSWINAGLFFSPFFFFFFSWESFISVLSLVTTFKGHLSKRLQKMLTGMTGCLTCIY